MKELSEEQALNKAAAICSASEHCEDEIRQKLMKWNLSEAAQTRILQRLINDKFIDENRYCKFFINDKLHFNKWGKQKIYQALLIKRIPKNIIKEKLDAVDSTDYEQILAEVLKHKRSSINAKSDYERDMKLMRFAIGKGFEPDIIRKHLANDIEEMD